MKKRTWLDIILFSMLIISIVFVGWRILLYSKSTFTYLNEYFWSNSFDEVTKEIITPIIIANLLCLLGSIFVLICLILSLWTKSNIFRSMEVTTRARIELVKEEIKIKRAARLVEKNANRKAKLQEKLNKLNNEEND